MNKTENRKVMSGSALRDKIFVASNTMADVVGSTMGARGHNVLLENPTFKERPEIVNDGVRIAREFYDKDPIINMVYQLIKQAALKTNDIAGDGTTCSTVLTGAFVAKGIGLIQDGMSPVNVRQLLKDNVKTVLEKLENSAVPITSIDQVKQIARISVQDETLGDIIGTVMHGVGMDGAVSIGNNLKNEITVEQSQGARFKCGHAGGVLTNQEKQEMSYDNARLLIMDYNIEDHEFDSRWLPFARKLVKANEKGDIEQVHVPVLVIVAEKLPQRIIQFLLMNVNIMKFVFIQAPSFGEKRKELLKDMCELTGATLVNKDDAIYIDRLTLDDLGTAKTLLVTKDHTTITVENTDNRLLDRISDIKGQITNAKSEMDIESLRQRLATLTGGVATINVGGLTTSEVQELKLRVEDAINASRSAMELGVVAGGGVALTQIAGQLSTPEPNFFEAMYAPAKKILTNGGYTNEQLQGVIDLIVDQNNGNGINIENLQAGNMIEMGIIDPLKVIKAALINASSVAGLLLTAGHAVYNEDDELETLKNVFKN